MNWTDFNTDDMIDLMNSENRQREQLSERTDRQKT